MPIFPFLIATKGILLNKVYFETITVIGFQTPESLTVYLSITILNKLPKKMNHI